MATIEEKIVSITELMNKGILTAEEFSKVITVLTGTMNNVEVTVEQTPMEIMYNKCFTDRIIGMYKSPGSCKWPSLTKDMILSGVTKVQIGWSTQEINRTYIQTYIDATNSYGAYLRQNIRILLDDDGQPTHIVYPIKLFGKDSDSFAELVKVNG